MVQKTLKHYAPKFREPKTGNRNRDDTKVMIAGVLIFLVLVVIQTITIPKSQLPVDNETFVVEIPAHDINPKP